MNSIEVYVLQRVPLVLAREKVLVEILAQIQRVKEATKNVSDHLSADPAFQFYFDDILTRELTRLHEFTKPTAEYSAMGKQVIQDFIRQNQPAAVPASTVNTP